jgi:NAD(P)-dependent dehydrogenase (short-subunit alcohol dehydrogenase family)
MRGFVTGNSSSAIALGMESAAAAGYTSPRAVHRIAAVKGSTQRSAAMQYFVTGATGFIGSRLVAKLLDREGAIVYVLVRPHRLPQLNLLRQRWGAGADRVIPVLGDLLQPGLGVSAADLDLLRGRVDHLFHLAAVYDLNASAQSQEAANVQGTRHAVELAHEIGARHFHLASSISAAGLYEGTFREDMFEEAEHLEHPYFRTKHESEAIVRKECRQPWRVYRPGIVVGDSRTGEIDKIDGPYYLFKPIQKLRKLLPPWMPFVGIEGGRLNLVPVDFVVAAMDHIAHLEGLDGGCFHLTDPHPRRVGDILDLFARAGHAPELSLRINSRMFGFVPEPLRQVLSGMTQLRRMGEQLMKDYGLPPGLLRFIDYPTRFDCRQAQLALEGSGIEVPPLEGYAWKLWDYWERNLDPDLFIERNLRHAVEGKVVLITGGGAGIGKATALKLAAAGASVIAIDRDEAPLRALEQEIQASGGKIATYRCDLTDFSQLDRMIESVLAQHGGVDILVNNAGHSIRRAIEHSYDRFHDYQRTMQLNYFAAVRVTLGLLPQMQKKKGGQVIAISSLGVLASAPRFSAYIASKAALEAFSRCAAAEFADDGIAFTIVNFPLVRTAMTAPTRFYQQADMLTPEEAADFVVRAILQRPDRITTRLGHFAELMNALAPKVARIVMNAGYRMFPESAAAMGRKEGDGEALVTPEQVAFAQFTRGFHF